VTRDESHVSVGGLLALGHVLRKKEKIKGRRKTKYEVRGRHTNRGRVEVVKEAEKKERSKGKQVVEREDQGRQRNKEDRSWTSQQVEEDTNGCFGAPRGEEGRTGW
jgi:hypothetical protein